MKREPPGKVSDGMALKKLGEVVTQFPVQTIVLIIVVTALLGSAFVFFGTEMEVSEDTYLPDTELTRAYAEIGAEYSSTNPVQVIVRGTGGDVLTRDSLLDMLNIEKAFLDDDDLSSTFATPDNLQESVSSIADIIVLGNMTLDAREQFLGMIGYLVGVLEPLSYDGFNSLILGLNSSVSSSIVILQSDATAAVKGSASVIIVNQMELMSLAAGMDMNQTAGSSIGSIGYLAVILSTPADNDVKGNATHMVLSQMELASLVGPGTEGVSTEQMAAFTAMLGPLNDTLSNSSASYYEKQLTVQGTIDALTLQIGAGGDSASIGFMTNIKGTLSDLHYILGSGAPDIVKDSAIAIMTGELASFSAPPATSPPDPNTVALAENLGSTLASLYTILSIETDQLIIDNAVNMVVSGFSLMDAPAGETGMGADFPDLGAFVNSGDMFSISTDIDTKIAYLENNMTGNSVKETLHALFEYDASADDELIENAGLVIDGMMVELGSISSSLTNLNGNLITLEESLSNPADKAVVNYLSAGFTESLTTMNEAAYGMQLLGEGLATSSMMDVMVQRFALSVSMMLSNDFSPAEMTADGTMIIVMLDSAPLPGETEEQQNERFLYLETHMVQIVEDEEHPNTGMNVMGMNLMLDEIMNVSQDSMNILLPAAGVLVLVILAIIFQNPLEILFSVLALIFAIVWVWGLGALFGFVFNPMTIAVPVLLVGLGIDYGIHLTLRYKEERAKGVKPRYASRNTIASVGTALLLATVATMIGFLSNVGSDMSVLREFGILCAAGILASFLIMVTFIPACKQVMDTRKERNPGKGKKNRLTDKNGKGGTARWKDVKGSGVSIINKGIGFGAVAARHPVIVIIIVLLITGVSSLGAMGLTTEFDLEDFLPEDMEITQNIVYLTDNFDYSVETSEILIKGDIASPEVLAAINATTGNMGDDAYVLKTYGRWGEQADASTILTLMWDAAEDQTATNPMDIYSPAFENMFFGNDTDGDWVPDTNIEALFAWIYTNESTKQSAGNYLHRADSGEFDGTVIRINVNTEGETKSGELYNELEEDAAPLKTLLNENGITMATVTGMPIMTHFLLTELTDSMYNSLIITIIFCLVVLTTVFYFIKRTLVLGIITTIPVTLCMVWTLGSMYLLGIPYSVLTVSVSAMTVSLGITYGIHITHRFLEDLQHFNDVDEACRYTLLHTGSALFGAAVTTIAGFGLLVFSLLPPMQQFGGVIALTILYSFLASIFVLPALLALWAKRSKQKGRV